MENFERLIEQAVSWVDGQEGKIDDELREAIKCRLIFRREFLAALEQDIEVIRTRSTKHFANCLSRLPSLAKSTSLGKAVPDAFSLKIQRRLASTVPPRPMVNISVEDALAHLKRLCQDAIDLERILDYRGPYNFRVCQFGFSYLDLTVGSDHFFVFLSLCLSRLLFGRCCLENRILRSISDRLFKPSS